MRSGARNGGYRGRFDHVTRPEPASGAVEFAFPCCGRSHRLADETRVTPVTCHRCGTRWSARWDVITGRVILRRLP